MKLRFRDARTHARTDGRTDGRTNGDIEALADAMRALKNGQPVRVSFGKKLLVTELVL